MTPRAAFALQSKGCAGLGSPFMGRLMGLMADRLSDATEVGRAVLRWAGDPSPNADNVPLRLAGALHAIKLEGLALSEVYPPMDVSDDVLWDAVDNAMREFAERILLWLESPPQTNEVRRSAVILAGLAALRSIRPGDVAIYELGASGGLNLRADQFWLELPSGGIGNASSAVHLQPTWNGPLPPTDLPDVVSRAGVDLNPLDPLSEAGRLRLLSYLWPDQHDRMERTTAAIEVARNVPANIENGDAGAWLQEQLAAPQGASIPVVVHTIAWQYFPEQTKQACEAAMRACPKPVARLSMEANDAGKGAEIILTASPQDAPISLGRADFHGRWINWTWAGGA